MRKQHPTRRTCGIVLAVFGYILNYLFQLELWMIFVLGLTMYQQDGPARCLNYYILLNIIYVQTPKRFLFRKRPGQLQPPRALAPLNPKNSSFPSANIVAATTFTFAFFSIDTWKGGLSELNNCDTWVAYVLAMLVYLLSSMFHVNMGAIYPSDSLFSFIPAVLVIFTHWVGT